MASHLSIHLPVQSVLTTLLLLLSLLQSPNQVSADLSLGHLQQGSDAQGSSFASFGLVDPDTQILHVVGTTFGKYWTHDDSKAASGGEDPACFYAVLQLPDTANSINQMDWLHGQVLGVQNVVEECHALWLDTAQSRAYIVGNTETPAEGILGPLFNPSAIGAENLVQAGQILDLSYDTNVLLDATSSVPPLTLVGGRIEEAARIHYPVAITATPTASDRLYVVTMLTDDATRNSDYDPGAQFDPTEIFTWGTGYRMYVRLYIARDIQLGANNAPTDTGNQAANLDNSISPGVSEEFATNGGEAVTVANMIAVSDTTLVVAGHTDGEGIGFSGSETDVGNTDGFVTALDIASNLAPRSANPTYRITSGEADYVTNLCFSDQNADYIFVTGYTEGHIVNPTANAPPVNATDVVVRGFVIKVQLSDMTPVWIQEFEATPTTPGQLTAVQVQGCTLTHDGSTLYVGGVVKAGGVLPQDTTAQPAGGTDLWVAQMGAQTGSTSDGKVVFVKQMGSEGNDSLARRSGLQADKSGNLIVIGNTYGEMYRQRGDNEQGYANVFLATFEKDTGEFVLPLDHHNFVTLPPRETLPPSPPTSAPAPTPAIEEDSGGSGDSIFLFILLFAAIAAVVAFAIYHMMYRIPKRDISTDRSKVLDYLHDFDVEDIDLKHSATGGWHCSYSGDLAEGVNRGQAGTLGGSAPYKDKVNDPLNARGGTRFSGRKPPNSPNQNEERFTIDDDEDVITFGTARGSRKERNGNSDNLITAYKDSDPSKGSGKKHRSASSSAQNSGLKTSRRDKAKERWQNREII